MMLGLLEQANSYHDRLRELAGIAESGRCWLYWSRRISFLGHPAAIKKEMLLRRDQASLDVGKRPVLFDQKCGHVDGISELIRHLLF